MLSSQFNCIRIFLILAMAAYLSRKTFAFASCLFLFIVISSVGILYHRQTSRLSTSTFETMSEADPPKPEPPGSDRDDSENLIPSFSFHPADSFATTDPISESAENKNWTFDPDKDAEDYGLDDGKCDAAFPDMYFEIERAATSWKQNRSITVEDVEVSWKATGLVRAMIYDGHVSSNASP